MEMMIASSIGLQVVNVLLLATLIFMYARNLTKIKSNFVVGLLIFAGLLLVQNLAGIFLGYGAAEMMKGPVESYAFTVSFIETIALLALFWISWK